MNAVDQMIATTLDHEGGYTVDHAGATNFGWTIGTMRRLGIDVDGDGDVDVADVKALTRDQAHALYKKHFFHKPKIDSLPAQLQAAVFDFHVNSGSHAQRVLQQLTNTVHQQCTGAPILPAIATDGAIGPRTVAAVAGAMQKIPDHFVDAYNIARRNFLIGLARANPGKYRKFAVSRTGDKGGWVRRVESMLPLRYHLTEQQWAELKL